MESCSLYLSLIWWGSVGQTKPMMVSLDELKLICTSLDQTSQSESSFGFRGRARMDTG